MTEMVFDVMDDVIRGMIALIVIAGVVGGVFVVPGVGDGRSPIDTVDAVDVIDVIDVIDVTDATEVTDVTEVTALTGMREVKCVSNLTGLNPLEVIGQLLSSAIHSNSQTKTLCLDILSISVRIESFRGQTWECRG